MENKINIAELLKDCPKGMELDCTMFDDVKFIEIEDDDKPICIRTGDIYRYLTKFGTWTFDENAKCVIFPKGKTTWEGFIPPCKFKVGDKITDKNKFIYRITEVTDKGYKLHDLKTTFITFEEADSYFVKVVDVFDITTLKPFESKVLVRDNDYDEWKGSFWGHLRQKADIKYDTIRGAYRQCIPYSDDTKYLLGTTNDCDEFYKTWANEEECFN